LTGSQNFASIRRNPGPPDRSVDSLGILESDNLLAGEQIFYPDFLPLDIPEPHCRIQARGYRGRHILGMEFAPGHHSYVAPCVLQVCDVHIALDKFELQFTFPGHYFWFCVPPANQQKLAVVVEGHVLGRLRLFAVETPEAVWGVAHASEVPELHHVVRATCRHPTSCLVERDAAYGLRVLSKNCLVREWNFQTLEIYFFVLFVKRIVITGALIFA